MFVFGLLQPVLNVKDQSGAEALLYFIGSRLNGGVHEAGRFQALHFNRAGHSVSAINRGY